MLLSTHPETSKAKAIVSINRPPNYVDRNALPTKSEPFKTVAEHTTIHALDIVVSGRDTNDVLEGILKQHGTLHYCKVFMKLSDIVSGDFFNEYIKTNNIAMISEGRPGVDETYSLNDGMLRMEVNKSTFERLGLEGKAIPSEGRKHVKTRYAVELNLRLPAMIRGKKGFERVLRAFNEVLNESKAWLFFNVAYPGVFSGPIAAFQPVIKTIAPSPRLVSHITSTTIQLPQEDDHESLLEMVEWLGLTILDSPWLKEQDGMSTHFNSFSDPGSVDDKAKLTSQTHHIRWQGFLHPTFIRTLLVGLLKRLPSESWFAMSAHAFDGRSYTILRTNEKIMVFNFCD